jgi:hypothetical protein
MFDAPSSDATVGRSASDCQETFRITESAALGDAADAFYEARTSRLVPYDPP